MYESENAGCLTGGRVVGLRTRRWLASHHDIAWETHSGASAKVGSQ
jgi:hypothetical protein